ncbi:MAG: class F sortase [Jatrophihabitantaceae bacterium]
MATIGRRLRWWLVLGWVGSGLAVIGFALVLPAGSRPARPVPVVDWGSTEPELAGRVSQQARPAGPPPVGSRLRITQFGIAAPIVPVTAPGGVLQVPADPGTIGWWAGGAVPGARQGSAVLAGHVNYAGTSGALAVLARIRPGAQITLAEPGVAPMRYSIRAVRSYPKASGIPASVFSRAGPARLILITCGGPFDPVSGNYLDNLVGYAYPIT